MGQIALDEVLALLRAALERGDQAQATALIEELRPADQADLVAELEGPDQVRLLTRLDPSESADILEEMNDEDAGALIGLLSPVDLAEILDELEANEAADLSGDLPPRRAAEALREMEEPQGVIPLLRYPGDGAGGPMKPAVITLRPSWTAEEALAELRRKCLDTDGYLAETFGYVASFGTAVLLIGVAAGWLWRLRAAVLSREQQRSIQAGDSLKPGPAPPVGRNGNDETTG